MIRPFISLGLRLGGVAGKFVAILALATQSGAAEVGKFTLFFSAINVLVFVVGLDFYQFTFREVLARRSAAGRLRIICGQQFFNLACYVVVGLIWITMMWTMIRPPFGLPLGWFILILLSDHAAQELSRLFTVLGKATHANIVYVAKTGSWAWVGAASVLFRPDPLTAADFYPLWLVANGLALLYGFMVLRHMFRGVPLSLPRKYRLWVVQGVRISSVFYITSVSTSALGVLDRFVLAKSQSVFTVGVYAFWQSITSLVPIVVYAMAGMHFLPRLIQAFKRSQWPDFVKLHRRFLLQSLAAGGGFAALILLSAPYIPELLARSDLQTPLGMIFLLASAAVLTALWQVPYQVLYSGNQDVFLACTILAVTVTSFGVNVVLVPVAGIIGAAFVAALANLVLFVVLSMRARRLLCEVMTLPTGGRKLEPP